MSTQDNKQTDVLSVQQIASFIHRPVEFVDQLITDGKLTPEHMTITGYFEWIQWAYNEGAILPDRRYQITITEELAVPDDFNLRLFIDMNEGGELVIEHNITSKWEGYTEWWKRLCTWWEVNRESLIQQVREAMPE